MSTLEDLLTLLTRLIVELWVNGRWDFMVAAAVGSVLAALAWWLAHVVSLNFNRQFSFRAEHYLYCGIAATATFLFSIVFFALRYTADVAQIMVSAWEVSIRADTLWSQDTFRKAYDSVYELRDALGRQLEDFTGKPHPNTTPTTVIPTTQDASKLKAAETYAAAAVAHFRTHYSFLSKILWARPGIAQDEIYADIQRVFASGRTHYAAEDAIRLAGREIRRGLERQVPRVVVLSRIVLVVAFLIVQALTFSLLIYAALADIKERRAPQPITGR